MEALTALWVWLHAWVFETLVQPALFALGLAMWAETAFEWTGLFLEGAIEVAAIALAFSALERWRPVERWADRRTIRVDVIYTFLNRLGVAPLAIFLLLAPAVDAFDGWLRLQGFIPWKLEDAFPALFAHPAVSFAAYLVVLDFVAYWLHRAQHQLGFWWALHALHHSQREMTFWTDNRNHLLDDLMTQAAFSLVALAIGVPPAQFALVVVATRVVESLSHANVRLDFGALGGRLLVSPRYHRVHHAIGLGHEGERRGCNFAVLFPAWDHLFGTANQRRIFPATGIRDQLHGRDYGEGFWRQQGLGLVRFAQALRPRAPWPGAGPASQA